MKVLLLALLVLGLSLRPANASDPREWEVVGPYRNVARLVGVSDLRHWFQAGGCRAGISAADPEGREPLLRCAAVLLGAAAPQPSLAALQRIARRALESGRVDPRGATYLGAWREVEIREEVLFPELAPDGSRLVAGGSIFLALEPERLDLRLLEVRAGGNGLPCAECRPAEGAWLDWRPIAGFEGLSLAFGLALPDHDPGYDAMLADLRRVALAAIHRQDAGESLARPAPATPSGLPDTRFGLTWTIQVYGRAQEPGQQVGHAWEIQVPLDQADRALQFRRSFPDLGLTVVADFDAPAGELRVRASGAAGDVVERRYAMKLPLWRAGGNVALGGALGLEPPAGPRELKVSAPEPYLHADLYAADLRRADAPYAGPDEFEILPAVAPSAGPRVTRPISLPRDLWLNTSPSNPEIWLNAGQAGDMGEVALDPAAPVTIRATLFLGQARPAADRPPDGEYRVVLPGSADPMGIILRSFRIDRAALAEQGAWIVFEWIQHDERLLFHAYRFPPVSP